jgi:short-subunit dehydrogenase
MSNSSSKGTALITGASTGIGAVYADRLAKRGYDLIVVARNEARLQALSDRLTKEVGRSVSPLGADLVDKADLARVEGILRDDRAITILVNNAGFGSITPLLNTDVDQMEDMIALNMTALMRLTYAAAPAFVARGAGTIVNIASIVGIAPEILNGVYGATKAYVLAFSHSLQHELADKGIRIQAVPCRSPVCAPTGVAQAAFLRPRGIFQAGKWCFALQVGSSPLRRAASSTASDTTPASVHSIPWCLHRAETLQSLNFSTRLLAIHNPARCRAA